MTHDHPQLKYLLGLDAFPKFGAVRLAKIYAGFSTPEQAWRSTLQELISAGIDPKSAQEFLSFRTTIEPEKLLETIVKENIRVTFLFDDTYPARLKEIYDPPFVLYSKGDLKNLAYPLAVVGTRNYSRYGQEVIAKLLPPLIEANVSIISGLAIGIDSLAHEATLKSNGITWSVLGTGIDKNSIYPNTNRQLAQKIIDSGGCIISEFKPGTLGMPYHFPMRNRIIAGLSFGTLVIEAAIKSGSLITAQLSLDYGREVMAVPGPVNSPISEGTNTLIKQGARLINSSQDILDLLDLKSLTSYSKNTSYVPKNQEESFLLGFLSHEPLHIDELVRLTNQPVQKIHSQILLLEINGAAKNLGNMEYIKLT